MLPKNWTIEYYSTPTGKSPIYKFIEAQSEKSKAKIHNTFELLIEFGTKLRLPHAKKITNTPLWELRILGKKSLRFFYLTKTDRSFLLLHAFVKKSKKTPRKEIKTALQRLHSYQNHH